MRVSHCNVAKQHMHQAALTGRLGLRMIFDAHILWTSKARFAREDSRVDCWAEGAHLVAVMHRGEQAGILRSLPTMATTLVLECGDTTHLLTLPRKYLANSKGRGTTDAHHSAQGGDREKNPRRQTVERLLTPLTSRVHATIASSLRVSPQWA